MRLRMYGATDKGLVRTSNQDAYFCSAEYGLVVVSDGMGGHKGGEIASQLVVTGLRDAFLETQQILVENVGPFLDEVLRKINSQILDHASRDENLRGMGATVNYLQFAGEYMAIGHAGDSRTYLVRGYRKPDLKPRYAIWPITIDHNVGTFVERGLLIPGRDCPPGPLNERQKSRLMRGMGVVADLKADLYCRAVQEGDVYLTCSDGVHGYVSDKDILKAVVSGPLAQAPHRIIEMMKGVGAPDNVTVVVSALSELEEPLRDFKEPVMDKSPYLVRLPSGEIQGPIGSEVIIKQWLGNEIPNNAEISSSLNRWVFLNDKDSLLSIYTEFNTEEVKTHLNFMAPESAYEQRGQRDSRVKANNNSILYSILFALLVVGFAAGYFYYMRMGTTEAHLP